MSSMSHANVVLSMEFQTLSEVAASSTKNAGREAAGESSAAKKIVRGPSGSQALLTSPCDE
jgi:hypothetical protein